MKFYLILIVLFLSACAGIVAPTGGPKDETPPVCIDYAPDTNTVNFNASRVSFYFNEYVNLVDITNQFIISPPPEKNPTITSKGKRVEVKFEAPLLPNTTYTMNFGNAVVDNNEGNILSGLSYTFSTGKYIDSLTLEGNVKDAFSLDYGKGLAVGLYDKKDDSTIFKNKPIYLAKSDSSGNFKFRYLRPGTYELVAFEDLNKNLKVESSEKIGYLNTLVTLDYNIKDSSKNTLFISPQYQAARSQIIEAKEFGKGVYRIITSGSNCNYKIEPAWDTAANDYRIITSKKCDTIFYYSAAEVKDSVKFTISAGNITEVKNIEIFSKKYPAFTINTSTSTKDYNYLDSFKVSFGTPVRDINDSLIRLFVDSIPLTGYAITHEKTDPFNIYIKYNWQQEKNYLIKLDTGAIKDIFGQQNDSAALSIKTAGESFFGTLGIIVANPANRNYIVELLNKEGTIVATHFISSTQTITYKNILPSQYKIKITDDENGNKEWDGGNYFTKQQPEAVFITPASIDVRANWELTDNTISPVFR